MLNKLLACWLGPKRWLCVDPFWFSSPGRIVSYLVDVATTGTLFIDTLTTIWEALLGYVIGALLGIGLGFVLARLETLARIVDPFIVAVNGIPRVAMAPILIIWFGIGVESKVVLAVSLVLFLTFSSQAPLSREQLTSLSRESPRIAGSWRHLRLADA